MLTFSGSSEVDLGKTQSPGCLFLGACSVFAAVQPLSAMSSSLQPLNFSTPGFSLLHYLPEFA